MLFKCKQFDVVQSEEVFKITTDATLLGALAFSDWDTSLAYNILEVGVGTGIISLMVAQRFPNAQIHGIDINKEAVVLAKKNVDNSIFQSRIQVELADILSYNKAGFFDAIIINPPYFEDDTVSISEVQRTARHLSFSYEILIEKLLQLINTKGTISMLHPFRYKDQIESCVRDGAKINKQIIISHYKGKPARNMITEIKKMPNEDRSTIQKSTSAFYLRDNQSSFSNEYVESLRDFLVIFS